jgi:signal transduction histidine kinase/CheY-like chemotaxis protein/HPt (histidine-containing phosphotransfer) domain-containing protein
MVMALSAGIAFWCGVALLVVGEYRAAAMSLTLALAEGGIWTLSRHRPAWASKLAHVCLGLALLAIGFAAVASRNSSLSLSFFAAAVPPIAGALLGRRTILTWTVLSVVVLAFVELMVFGDQSSFVTQLSRFILLVIFVIASAGMALVLENLTVRQIESLDTRESAVRKLLSDLATANHELADARDAALDASRAKGEFLAAMSHEIRTPLNAVIGLTGVLLDTKLDEEQHEFATTIRSSGNSLLALINDILDFSKIEAGKIELESAPFDVIDCVEDALELVSVRAAEKRLRLSYFVDMDVPAKIVGDSGRVRQVLVNLVSNAVKFTEKGAVTVRVGLSRTTGPNRVIMHISVTDTGIGIKTEQMGLLFEPFMQADASTTSKFGGTGLGLAICRRLANRMAGSTWAESTFGDGSTFHFTFSATVHEPARELVTTKRAARVVIADREQRKAFLGQLKRIGVHGHGHGSIPELLRALQSREADASDVIMIDNEFVMDGHHELDDLRTPLLVVLATPLTHRSTIPARNAARIVHLTVPVRHEQLAEMLGTNAVNGAGSSVATEEPSSPQSMRRLRVLIAEDNPVNQRVAKLLVERAGHYTDVVGNGAEAVREVAQRHYDVVLMDMRMPEMDGTTATRRIRETLPKERWPYIIALTANASSMDRDACLEAGMDAFLSKPITGGELRNALAEVRVRPNKLQESSDVAQSEDFDPDRLEELAELTDNDNEAISAIVKEFMQSAAEHIRSMKEAVDAENAAALVRAAHTLKGSSGQIGARAVMGASAEIETLGVAANFTAAKDRVATVERKVSVVQESIYRWIASRKINVTNKI